MRAVDPEGADLDYLRRRAKRQLRDRARGLRSAIPPVARAARCGRIVERLKALPEALSARAVALFWPMETRGEVDLRLLDEHLRCAEARVYYPFMSGANRAEPGFALVVEPDALAAGDHEFLEPPPGAPAARIGELDLVIVPALAVSATGHRLGYGAGFYDTVLPKFCPPALSVAVAYDFELLPELPTTAGDVACDVVVTDSRTLRFR
jgi:5-formyltetrahydrofolate cyclo-ligase